MTVILILFTILVFLGIDYLVHRPVPEPERVFSEGVFGLPALGIPEGIALARNHTWIRKEADGTFTLGVDGFLTRTAGAFSRITLPATGNVVTHAKPGIALCNREKLIGLQSPVVGRVVQVNDAVQNDPDLVRRDPYGKGWLVKVRAFSELDKSAQFLVRRPAEWLKQQFESAADFLLARTAAPAIVTMRDGGLVTEGALQEFGAEVWEEFGRTFANLNGTTTS
jgi:glycine cleavage system H protein